MAAPRPATSSPSAHFERLLKQRQLVPNRKFKEVEIIHIDIGGANGFSSDNFIDKIGELSQTQKVKNSGGFMILRPKQGVDIFTKSSTFYNSESNVNQINQSTINNNNHNQFGHTNQFQTQSRSQSSNPKPRSLTNINIQNNSYNYTHNNQSTHSNCFEALPSLKKHQNEPVLFETQKCKDWKVPMFTWNAEHQNAIILANKRKNFKKEDLSILHETGDSYIMQSEMIQSNQHKKRKTTDCAYQSPRPQKRQRTISISPSTVSSNYSPNASNPNNHNHNHNNDNFDTLTVSTNTTMSSVSTNASNLSAPNANLAGFFMDNMDGNNYCNENDLNFFRGFTCLCNDTHSKYKKQSVSSYIHEIEQSTNPAELNNLTNLTIEDKVLSLGKWFHSGKESQYGHIEGGDGVTCYDEKSPLQACELRRYGPFGQLDDSEITNGVQTPYIYIGQPYTYFPWHDEDMNFFAMNHLLYGGNKVWFCIQPNDYDKVMAFFRKQFKHYYPDCLTPLQHKICFMDPYIFSCLGVTVYYMIQRPGDIVIAPPGGLHCGINESFNIAESVNFMSWSDEQWKLCLSGMLIKQYNYHDCLTECTCCTQTCSNPENRFDCNCKYCESQKCPCDLHVFLDINELARRCRMHEPTKAPSIDVVPSYVMQSHNNNYGKAYEIYHPRKMSENEIDQRWTDPPKCVKESVYPTKDKQDMKFYPAICFDNRIVKRNVLILEYQYQMDFISFGDYYQIVDQDAVIWPGGLTPDVWRDPPVELQHGYYAKELLNGNVVKKRGSNNNKGLGGQQSLIRRRLKGTPSFDFLNIKLNDKSPLIGTEWEHRHGLIYAYPPGSRKYNLDIRKKKVAERVRQKDELEVNLIQLKRNEQSVKEYNNNINKNNNNNNGNSDSNGTHGSSSFDDDNSNSNNGRNNHGTDYMNGTTTKESVVYQTEHPSDSESSSSSNSKQAQSDISVSDDGSDWNPGDNKWMGSLPEYQFKGLRVNKNKRKMNDGGDDGGGNGGRRYNTRSSKSNSPAIVEPIPSFALPSSPKRRRKRHSKRSDKKEKKDRKKHKRKSDTSSSKSKKKKTRKSSRISRQKSKEVLISKQIQRNKNHDESDSDYSE